MGMGELYGPLRAEVRGCGWNFYTPDDRYLGCVAKQRGGKGGDRFTWYLAAPEGPFARLRTERCLSYEEAMPHIYAAWELYGSAMEAAMHKEARAS